MSALEYIFWGSLLMTIYPYVIYPLLVVVWARFFPWSWQKGGEQLPISLIISVYNEEGVIRQKLENALALAYPADKLEILVVSDGSTDNTNQIVSACKDKRVKLKAYARTGKTACLNRAVVEAQGEILVFTDANSMFPPQALAMIARNFVDEKVGLVSGWTKYRHPDSEIEETPGIYSRLEKITKEAESLITSCVGADGAIFAIRRLLFCQLQAGDINDFVIPLNILGQGRRVVLDADVYCLEEPSGGGTREFHRQARITNRTLGAIRQNCRYLNPIVYGAFAFFLLSHKVLRFLVPFFAVLTFISALLLLSKSLIYGTVFGMICVLLFAGLSGILGLVHSRLIDICATFLLTNAGQVVGWFRFLTGRSDTLWTPQR
jgi:glycosyltransferase involved in cell wall biosynthesis